MLPTIANRKDKSSNSNQTSLMWQSSALTHVGTVRTTNEDAIFEHATSGLWAVADGMGGHEAGEVASSMIVHALENVQVKRRLSHAVEYIDKELQAVNRRIQQHSEMILQNRTLGSTVVALVIRDHIGVCLWAGDSRLYKYREGSLEKMSRDHSRVEELISMGLLLPENAKDHPDANVITRAVGAYSELFLDNCVFQVDSDETYLLCSDGLYNSLNDEEIMEQLRYSDVALCASGLIDKALYRNASDNVSVVVVRARE